MDTMVMDNDGARVGHGVKPTDKRVKESQPVQMTCQYEVIDAVFRREDAHSNNGDTVAKMVCHVVGKIRKHDRPDVAIIVQMDSGFFEQKLFKVFKNLGIGYICGGKLEEPVKELVAQNGSNEAVWGRYEQGRQVCQYLEFGTRCANWKRFRRALFCRPLYENAQLPPFARPNTALVTNLGMGQDIDAALVKAGCGQWLQAQVILASDHSRGSDELVHRSLKDFGFEQYSFKHFAPNAAFDDTVLLAFFLYETFKQDVCTPVIACW